MRMVDFSELVGKKIIAVEGLHVDSWDVKFICDGPIYSMYHQVDCCEVVIVNDIVGDIADLVDAFVVSAIETTNRDNSPSDYSESFTWTFYTIQTNKGAVTIRWLGESNGYYSESVTFAEMGI